MSSTLGCFTCSELQLGRPCPSAATDRETWRAGFCYFCFFCFFAFCPSAANDRETQRAGFCFRSLVNHYHDEPQVDPHLLCPRASWLGKLITRCPSCTVDPLFAQEVAITRSLQEEKAKFAASSLEVRVITIVSSTIMIITTFVIAIITIFIIVIIVASESLHLAFQSVKFWIDLETHCIFWPSGIFQDDITCCI